jgi:hypothetical protein
MITLQEAVKRLDRDMDALLARQLRQERDRMRADGVDEEDIRAFARLKIEAFRDVKEFALPSIVAAALGETGTAARLH